QTVLDWAKQAAPGDIAASQHLRIALALYDDRLRKTQEIQLLNARSPAASCRLLTCCCSPFPVSTSSALPTSRGRWGPSSTMPTPSPSPAVQACDHPVTRAIT